MSVDFRELQAALPGADDAFLLTAMKADWDIPTAQAAWQDELVRQLDAALAENASLKAKRPGVSPVPAGYEGPRKTAAKSHGHDNAIAEADERIRAKMDQGLDRQAAIAAVFRADPDLHAACKAATQDKLR